MPTSKTAARSKAEAKPRARKPTTRSGKAAASVTESVLPETTASVMRVARELRRWSDHVLGIAGSATELSLNLAKAGARRPSQQAAIAKAGSLLRQARETAGMTTKEVGKAIDIKDISLLEQAEVGRVVLPFEVILRLAAVLGRHDPLTFAMKLARSYNPTLWKGLEDLGIGRLVVQAGRERELANIYRSNDAARRLSDADFAAVLAFVKTGFDAAVQFRSASPPRSGRAGDDAQ
ncbi:helix-turn-helix domain-containing protein [Piscinibacter sakaiensis]|uniref:helix-turn-helix domain-containing protein n=1 Tax=Piscinibacter sakaiensis TaxID=1547922 RepID=UPI003AAA7931